MAEGGARVASFDQTGAEWDRVRAVNVKGVFFGAKHVIPHLRAAGKGSIINLSSHAGLAGIGGIAPCRASKRAVRRMTRNDAITCAAEKIRMNSIHPACIRTPMVENHLRAPATATAPDLETAKAAAGAAHPIGSMGQADDIARAVVWRASEKATFVTGAGIATDRGDTAR